MRRIFRCFITPSLGLLAFIATWERLGFLEHSGGFWYRTFGTMISVTTSIMFVGVLDAIHRWSMSKQYTYPRARLVYDEGEPIIEAPEPMTMIEAPRRKVIRFDEWWH